jgi:hypothetical protein
MNYDPEAWHDLFEATVGAAASLTGLLFVAVSINLAAIVKSKVLPQRALETLCLLMTLLLLSIFVLVPGQGRDALGAELLGLGLVVIVVLLAARLRIKHPAEDPWHWKVLPVVFILLGTLPTIAAGISLLANGGGGISWLVASIVLGLLAAVANAWVLLIEIHR